MTQRQRMHRQLVIATRRLLSAFWLLSTGWAKSVVCPPARIWATNPRKTFEKMPKIVDHDAYKLDLAQRAVSYFSEHGYGGTSMRKIADHLGLSKSALYHYFPTKEDLFLACTKQVMAAFDSDLIDPEASEAENLSRLTAVLRRDFDTEMALIFDYLRGKSADEIAADEAMQIAMQAYRNVITAIVGPERAEETLARLMGELLLDYLSGR